MALNGVHLKLTWLQSRPHCEIGCLRCAMPGAWAAATFRLQTERGCCMVAAEAVGQVKTDGGTDGRECVRERWHPGEAAEELADATAVFLDRAYQLQPN